MNRLLISAAHKSSGKTTLSIGLCAALRQRGLRVQPFKKGPDYIDPMWLGRAAGRPCHNLDFYTMPHDEILATLHQQATDADIALIEGNKGLYDGLDIEGSNSNAALASLSHTPVILVIDVQGMTRGIAPLILGYQAFEKDIRIAGVILNQIRGARHESKLRAVIEHYTDVPVVGAVYHDPQLSITERHLGLIPSNENREAERKISLIGERISQQVELDTLLVMASQAPSLPIAAKSPPAAAPRPASDVRLAVAMDEAFGFYYPGDLQALEAAGAELVPFSTLRDPRLPEVDALFIGGGFPETQMQALAANQSLREDIRRAIERGLPAYAECGGLMYLCRQLYWGEQQAQMCGVIPADVRMHPRPMGRGYVRLRETGHGLWPPGEAEPAEGYPGHEFHYSALENIDAPLEFAYEVARGTGVDGRHDGIVYKNLLACYAHLRDTRYHHWARRFVNFIRQHKISRNHV